MCALQEGFELRKPAREEKEKAPKMMEIFNVFNDFCYVSFYQRDYFKE